MRAKVSLPILAVSFLVSSAAGQGFWSNCTQYTLGWDKETVYRRIMVGQCTDGGGKQRYSFLPLDDCVTNAEGSMLPKKSGGVSYSCAKCTHKEAILSCDCGTSFNRAAASSSIDLNTVIKNVDGILGCYDFKGVEISSMDASPA